MALPTTVLTVLIADTKQFQAEMAKADATMAKFGATGDAAGSKWSNFANKASTAVIGVGLAVGAVAVKLAYDYTTAIDQVGQESNLTQGQLEQLRKTALKVSSDTATSAKDIANAYLLTTKAGYDLSKSTAAVTAAAKFAKAENGNLNDSLTASITIQKAGIPGTKSVAQTMDIFTNAVKNSRLSADDLTSALSGKTAAAFAAFHIHIQDAVTLLAAFANVGLTGTRSTQAIKTGLSALDAPMVSTTGKFTTTAKALAQYGLNQQTLASETKRPGGILDVLKQMDLAWQKNATGAERAQGIVSFFDQIFGKTAGPAFTDVLTQLTSGKLTGLVNAINKPGTTNSAFAQWLKTPAGAWDNFKTAAENALIPLGEFLLPDLTKIATWAKGVLDYFKAHPILEKIASDAAIGLFGAAVAYKIASALSKIWGTVNSKVQTGLLADIARNTAITAGEGGTGGLGGTGGFGSGVLRFTFVDAAALGVMAASAVNSVRIAASHNQAYFQTDPFQKFVDWITNTNPSSYGGPASTAVKKFPGGGASQLGNYSIPVPLPVTFSSAVPGFPGGGASSIRHPPKRTTKVTVKVGPRG